MSEMYPNADEACESCLKVRDEALLEAKTYREASEAWRSCFERVENELKGLKSRDTVTVEHHRLVCETWKGREEHAIDQRNRERIAKDDARHQLALAEALIERLKLRAYEPEEKPTALELGLRLWSNEIKRAGDGIKASFERGRRAGERAHHAVKETAKKAAHAACDFFMAKGWMFPVLGVVWLGVAMSARAYYHVGAPPAQPIVESTVHWRSTGCASVATVTPSGLNVDPLQSRRGELTLGTALAVGGMLIFPHSEVGDKCPACKRGCYGCRIQAWDGWQERLIFDGCVACLVERLRTPVAGVAPVDSKAKAWR